MKFPLLLLIVSPRQLLLLLIVPPRHLMAIMFANHLTPLMPPIVTSTFVHLPEINNGYSGIIGSVICLIDA